MKDNLKKALRTLQTSFPRLVETKFAAMRFCRRKFRLLYEQDFGALALFPDSSTTLLLDVGANRGQSTDSMLLKTKNARIQLFEPNPMLSDRLRELYQANERVSVHRFGLGDNTVEQMLYIPYYRKWMFDGLASFDRDAASMWLQSRVFFYRERYLSVQGVRTKIRRLDDLNLSPFFIKLDIQGYEFQALKGGEATIRTHEPILLIESPEERIIDFLAVFGYRSYAFRRGVFFPGTCGDLNTFFMTASKSFYVKDRIAEGRTLTASKEGCVALPVDGEPEIPGG
jgi:FkbM family methyltransferase